MIDYYARIAPALLPHLRGRPLTLIRYPERGRRASASSRSAARRTAPTGCGRRRLSRQPRAATIDFCVCDDLPTLVWLAQLAALELHPSLSLADDIEQPTVLAFDLDPGPPATIVECCRVALRLRELFARFGLECFPKTLGLEGDAGLRAAQRRRRPTRRRSRSPTPSPRRSSAPSPTGRLEDDEGACGKGKVFVDWSQNTAAKTTVAVYSLRARERPTASTPLHWDEVEAAGRRRRPRRAALRGRATCSSGSRSTATCSRRCSSSSRSCPRRGLELGQTRGLSRAAGGRPACGSRAASSRRRTGVV